MKQIIFNWSFVAIVIFYLRGHFWQLIWWPVLGLVFCHVSVNLNNRSDFFQFLISDFFVWQFSTSCLILDLAQLLQKWFSFTHKKK